MKKLLYESLDDFRKNELNERIILGKKNMLMAVMKDPEKNGDLLKRVFNLQVDKWPEVGEIINNLSPKEKKDIAIDTLQLMMSKKVSNVMLPLIKTSLESDAKIELNHTGKIDGF